MGTGSRGWNGSSDQTRQLGLDGTTQLLKTAFDHGVTFWDSADEYGSHPNLRAALKSGIPRDKVTILTKTRATTEAQMRADLDRFRQEIGTDHLDIVLLHCVSDDRWPQHLAGPMFPVGAGAELCGRLFAGDAQLGGVSEHGEADSGGERAGVSLLGGFWQVAGGRSQVAGRRKVAGFRNAKGAASF